MPDPRYVMLTDRAPRVNVLGNPARAPRPTIEFTTDAKPPRAFFSSPFFASPFFSS